MSLCSGPKQNQPRPEERVRGTGQVTGVLPATPFPSCPPPFVFGLKTAVELLLNVAVRLSPGGAAGPQGTEVNTGSLSGVMDPAVLLPLAKASIGDC